MKRLCLLLLGTIPLMFSSCSEDDFATSSNNGNGNVTFNISLPQKFKSRVVGDGTSASYLNYAVYEYDASSGSATWVNSGNATFSTVNDEATVSLNLINGKNYKIAFFAQSPASMTEGSEVYTFNGEAETVTVNYDNMNSASNIDDAYDCFYNTYETGPIGNASQNFSVVLNRAVAQVNWGTDDLTSVASEYGTNGAYIQTTLKTNANSVLNLLTGETSVPINVTLSDFAAPTTATFPMADYSYVAMEYLLAPSTSSTVYDLQLQITNAGNPSGSSLSNTLTVSNATVQANYRTNIYGSLLTTSTNFTVTKNSTWDNTQYNYPQTWDGTSSTTPTIDTDTKTVTLNQPSDLAGLASLLASTNNYDNFATYTIELKNDFDMGNHPFSGIGNATRSGTELDGTSFKGTIDGGGHTISNLNITAAETTNEVVGFIPNLDGSTATVTNLNFDGVSISAPNAKQAGIIGVLSGGATVSNVKVLSGTVSSSEGAGGVVGRVILSGNVSQCENHATIASQNTNAGGIIGAAYYTATGTSLITVSNCNNYGNVSGTSQAIGGIVGLSSANISNCNNYGTVTGGTTSTGGIVGQQVSAGSVKGCINTGKVIGGSGYGAGGVVGWVRYQADGYTYQEIIEVSGCSNSAVVSGSTGVGGIVGVWYNCGSCTGNTNTAPSLSASEGFVAGIVGNSQWNESGPTVTGDTNMLYVTGNYSTTSLDNMTGSLKAQYVYVNSSANVEDENNSSTLPAGN